MSHACVLVALPPDTTEIEAAVQEQMAPFDENDDLFRDGSRWDWYTIGGRFTGKLTGYDPNADPANIETCDLCNGTGTRTDMVVSNGCNGCRGEGKRVKWPTQWRRYEGDVRRKKDLARDVAAYAFLRDHKWNEAERLGWFGTSTATECERAGETPNICKFAQNGYEIVSWGEEWDVWKEKFHKRFIAPLPDETILVVVDYHV